MSNRILVVDDEASIRQSLYDVLTMEDYEVVLAQHAEDGLSKLEQNSFDLIISDIKMPKMDGLEFLQLLRQRQPKIPVLMISGHGNADTEAQAKALGAYAFLSKPIDLMQLLSQVEDALASVEL